MPQHLARACGFFQGAELTKRDVFAELSDLPKPDTSQQQFGGTLGPWPRQQERLSVRQVAAGARLIWNVSPLKGITHDSIIVARTACGVINRERHRDSR